MIQKGARKKAKVKKENVGKAAHKKNRGLALCRIPNQILKVSVNNAACQVAQVKRQPLLLLLLKSHGAHF